MNEIASLIGIAAAADNPAVVAVVLVIVIAVAALLIWIRMRGIEVVAEDPPAEAVEEEDITEDNAVLEVAPVPVVAVERRTPLLISRMHERLAEAYRANDRAEILRHQARLVRSGYEPPANFEDCLDVLDTGIYTRVKNIKAVE